jgi:hypothetical protein
VKIIRGNSIKIIFKSPSVDGLLRSEFKNPCREIGFQWVYTKIFSPKKVKKKTDKAVTWYDYLVEIEKLATYVVANKINFIFFGFLHLSVFFSSAF